MIIWPAIFINVLQRIRGRQMSGKKPIGKTEITSQLTSNLSAMKKFGIERIGLFGSVVRGEAKGESDIDILVEFKKGQEKFSNLMGLYFYLQNLLGRKIDLVTRESLSAYLAPHILKEVEYIETAS